MSAPSSPFPRVGSRRPRPAFAARTWLFGIALLGLAPAPAGAQAPGDRAPPPTPAPTAEVDPRRFLHASAGAFGTLDFTALGGREQLVAIVEGQRRRMGVDVHALVAVRRVLADTDRAQASLVRGAGDDALVATLVLHGRYDANEVPNAFRGILPGLARALWYPTRIEGRRAYDIGVAALIELSPSDWLVARRLGGSLPLPAHDAPPALADAVRALAAAPAPTTGVQVGQGALVGPPTALPGSPLPATVLELFHGLVRGEGALVRDDGYTATFAAELHHESDAIAWESDTRAAFVGLAEWIRVPTSEVVGEVRRDGRRLEGRVHLSPRAVDAFVARLGGRPLLSTEPSEAAPP